LFPFHVVFDEALQILQWGLSLPKLVRARGDKLIDSVHPQVPGLETNKKFTQLFTVTNPATATANWTFRDALGW
jgi:hypothetical protein